MKRQSIRSVKSCGAVSISKHLRIHTVLGTMMEKIDQENVYRCKNYVEVRTKKMIKKS